MILDQLVLHNFGVYRGRHVVDLTPKSAKQPIVLFGGLNGGGKTTFLDGLQLALYGKNARCSNRGVLAYDEFLRRSVSHAAKDEGSAVEIQFRHNSEGQEHTYRVHRSWGGNGTTIREHVEVTKDGVLDPVLTDAWGEYVEDFMPARISHLFFFDGEQIEGFADWRNSKELLSTAIHSLLGLDIVDRLASDLTVLQRRKRAVAASAVDRKELDELSTKVAKYEENRSELVTQRAQNQNELDRAEKALRDVEQRFKAEGGDLYERRRELELKRGEIAQRVAAVEQELRDLSEGGAPFLLVRELLLHTAKQAAREERAGVSLTMGRLLDERDARVVALLRSAKAEQGAIAKVENFLAADRKRHRENAHVDAYLELTPDAHASMRTLSRTELDDIDRRKSKLLDNWEALHGSLVELERMLAGVPDRESIELLLKRREECTADVAHRRAKIEVLDEQFASTSAELDRLNSRLSNKLERVADGELEVEDSARIVRHAERVRKSLEVFRTLVVGHHVRRIERLVLDGFRHLLRKESLVANIHIDPQALSVDLLGRDGQQVSPDRLSAGERQLLAVSLLWGLARASGRPLPAIIDTPLGRLDSSHRKHLVDRYFPFASHQVLLLSTDEEIDAEHHERLKPWIGRSYRLDFDDRTGSTSVQHGYFW